MRVMTALITGARKEYQPLILKSARQLLSQDDEEFVLIQQRGAEEALAHANRLMSEQEQYAICDVIRTKAQCAWLVGAKRCLIMGCVRCTREQEGFHECEQFVRRELYEVDRWHLFDDISAACLTPTPEVVLLC